MLEAAFSSKNMKLAVLADIHANFIALETVADHIQRWQPDHVVVAGDMVNRGPRPRECLEFVLEKAKIDNWQLIRGNHEDYVISFAHPARISHDLEFELYRSAYWTYQQLAEDVSMLEKMINQVDLFAPNGDWVQIVHASVRSNRDGLFPENTEDQLRPKIYQDEQEPPAVFCTGHTHWPFVRWLDKTLVINVGSVGLPFDGDRRSAYAQITWDTGQWQAEIIRLDYDWHQTEQDFFETGYLAEGGPLVELILDELRIARPHLFRWTQQYERDVMAGQITIAESVPLFLAKRRVELQDDKNN